MLARSAMTVVFAPGEFISQGSPASAGLTAGDAPKSQDMASYPWKCHSDAVPLETAEVERGKPRERETQIMV